MNCRRYTALAIACVMSAGCVITPEETETHRRSIEAWERVEIARANANAKRFDALAEVARRGDTTAQVAVAFAVGAPGAGGGGVAPTPMPTPPDSEARAYRWAALILPTATALGSGYFGYKLGVVSSNNAARQAEASYGAMGQLGTAGINGIRDVALGGFDTFGAQPTGMSLTINGNGNAGAIGGPATLDNSRRCAPSFQLTGPGGAGGTGGAGNNSAGGAGAAGPSFNLPFNC